MSDTRLCRYWCLRRVNEPHNCRTRRRKDGCGHVARHLAQFRAAGTGRNGPTFDKCSGGVAEPGAVELATDYDCYDIPHRLRHRNRRGYRHHHGAADVGHHEHCHGHRGRYPAYPPLTAPSATPHIKPDPVSKKPDSKVINKTPTDHYQHEKDKRAKREVPEDERMAAARREYKAMLEAQAAKGKGGRPKKKPAVTADPDADPEDLSADD